MDFMFKPVTGKIWDHWIYRDSRTMIYHLFYLYIPELDVENSWKVGHATSKDLKEFKEQKIVLEADKKQVHWIDKHLATGSIIDFEGRYAMILTGHSTVFGEAPCLAWSDDLYDWEFDDSGPLVLPIDAKGELEGPAEWGNPDGDCCGFCDPYVFRLNNDDTVYFILNARINKGEKQGRGRAALFSSKDLYKWKYERTLPSPHIFKRMETQQIIKRKGKWYLIFSSWPHLISDEYKAEFAGKEQAAAFVLTSNKMEGPYEFKGSTRLFPDINAYICKIVEDPSGVDRVLTILMKNGETGIAKAYKVKYPEEGGIEVLMDE